MWTQQEGDGFGSLPERICQILKGRTDVRPN